MEQPDGTVENTLLLQRSYFLCLVTAGGILSRLRVRVDLSNENEKLVRVPARAIYFAKNCSESTAPQ